MKRIDHATAAADLFGAGKDGFTEGDPVHGVPATVVTSDWTNGLQEEIVHVIEDAGLTPSNGDFAQLLAALKIVTTGELQLANWIEQTPLESAVNALVHDGTAWILVTDGGTSNVYTSTDGVTWAGLTHYSAAYVVRGVACDGLGTVVEVGPQVNVFGTPRALILVSVDHGATAARCDGSDAYGLTSADADLNAVAYGDGVWAAVGRRTVSAVDYFVALVSTDDGLTWTEVLGDVGGSAAKGVAYDGAGTWVAVGKSVASSGAWVSADSGVTWTPAAGMVGGAELRGVVWSVVCGRWLVVDDSGGVLSSIDTDTWTRVALGLGPLYGIAEHGGVVVAVGATGLVLTSRDGTTWTRRMLGTPWDLFAVANGTGQWIVAGAFGVLHGSLRLV